MASIRGSQNPDEGVRDASHVNRSLMKFEAAG
jgi:hypothetical protein